MNPTDDVPAGTSGPAGERPTWVKVLRDQRKVVALALLLAAASLWIFVPMGEWQVGVFVAIGMLLGLGNHVATELSLLKMISSGAQMSRSEIASSALVRLLFVSVPAVVIAVAFWSVGLTALIGLALFRLITLVMTGIPLLKELKA
ncbi:MAG TPA: hypothetical protein VFJ09_02025 [Nocardioidaceae bacterium]|nr:hypothetical protein [Nocardioidaceae bacterium]